MNHFLYIYIIMSLVSLSAWAAPTTFNFQASIRKPDGTRLESPDVSFRFKYLNAAGTCTVYIEDFNNLSMVGSQGSLSVNLGNGAKAFPPTVTTLNQTFNNSASNVMACAEGGTYTPTLLSERRILSVEFFYVGSGGLQYLNGIEINSVPYAMYSSDAEKLGGTAAALYAKFSDFTTCTGGDVLTYNGTAFSCIAPGASSSFTGSLVGDVSGTQTTTVVDSVGGKTSTEIATSVTDTQAATSAATASTLVKRDGSGNASFITASATNFSGRNLVLFEPTDTNKVTVKAPTTFTGGDYVLTLPANDGAAGQVLSTDGSGVTSWIPAASGSVTSVGASAPLLSSGGSTPNISMPAATAAVDGYLSATDFTTFNNKASTGTGTVNQIPKYTAAGAIGNSNISDNGTLVAISTDATVNGLTIGRGNSNLIDNTAIGLGALASNTTGSFNIATGTYVLNQNTTGSANVAAGDRSLNSNTTGNDNTAYGDNSLRANTTGNYNVAMGSQASALNITGSHNVAIGKDALASSTTGNNNSAVGSNSGTQITTGSNNSTFGYLSGSLITTGSNNVVIGSNTGTTIATTSNNIILSDGAGNIRQQIDSSGLVGIGMAPSTYMLNVNGDINIPTGSNFKINGVNLATGGGSVTNVATGTGLTGGPITSTGTINLADTAVTPNTYGSASAVPNFTVDAQGRLTAAGSSAYQDATGAAKGVVSVGTNLQVAAGVISLQNASTTNTGALTNTDWNTFNSKQAAGNYITDLTGDVTAAGPGSSAATIANLAVTNAKINDVAFGKITGLPTTLSGYGITDSVRNAGVGAGNIVSSIQSGNTAGRPAFGTDGRIYIDTQAGAIYRDSGAAWVAVTAAGAAGSSAFNLARVASLGNLALSGTLTIDGVAVVAGDRVLAKNQTTQAGNGVYVVAAGAWTRATDIDTWGEALGYKVQVTEGNNGAGVVYTSTTGIAGTLNSTAIDFYSNGGNSTRSNTSIGVGALTQNTTGSFNVATGLSALTLNTTGGFNSAYGVLALGANTSGTNNSAYGTFAMSSVTGGSYNSAFGTSALGSVTSADNNIAFGTRALGTNVTGADNTAAGYQALYNNKASNNTAFGSYALFANTTGTLNTAIGKDSGNAITTGSNNVVIGSNDGAGIATSSNNIILSDGSGNIRQQIDSVGRVGIGMAPATYMLNVNGDINIPTGSNFKINGVNLAAGGGTVTDVSSANIDIAVATSTSTPVLTLNSGVTGGAGDANKIAKLSAAGQLTAAMLPATAVTTATTLAGDVTGTTGANSVDRIKGATVTYTGIASGNFLKYNGAAWINTVPAITDIKSIVSGNFLTAAGTCAAGSSLSYSSVNDNISCQAYALTSAQVTTALTYTPVNKAGDTMSGSLDVASTVSANATTEGTVIAYVNSGAGYAIPDATLNVRQILLTANTTITLPAFAAPAGKVFNLTVFVKQDATGSRTIAWAGSGGDTIKWDTGLASVFSANPNKITILQFVKPAHETVWYATEVWRED